LVKAYNYKRWLSFALFNLCLVALLGVTLRSKMLFPMEALDFKYLIHAHSHMAFCGWITLSLVSLLCFHVLPRKLSLGVKYVRILSGLLVSTLAMVIAFLFQGYGPVSISFSTLFIVFTYFFAYHFLRDLRGVALSPATRILVQTAMCCLVLSSAGPFTLAYVIASKSGDVFLYRDATYTYLHLQYNGFFALSIFALLIHHFEKDFDAILKRKALLFARALSISIFPSLFISYLWHFPNLFVNIIAGIGCACIIITLYLLYSFLNKLQALKQGVHPFVRVVGALSLLAFSLKSVLQMGTIIPKLGILVFGDRTIIIGYLHLVLLGFATLFILAYLLQYDILDLHHRFTRIAVGWFTAMVIINELILSAQGFGNLLKLSNSMYTWMLWGVAILLFFNAILIFVSRILYMEKRDSWRKA
jgi:hypothetical protein